MMTDKAYEIGWWIESEDEEVYGPVSRETLRRFLQEEVISRNTLVRHCTEETPRPLADVPGMLDGLEIPHTAPVTGDRLAEVWPSSRTQREELGAGSFECVRHRRPAILVCVRCHAPYCRKCQVKPHRRPYYLCRRCQNSFHNRRVGAYFLDSLLLYAVLFPTSLAVDMLTELSGSVTDVSAIALNQLVSVVFLILFVLRDSLMQGAGPGKRLVGLQVVKASDGRTPLGHGQAVIRYLPFLIPCVVIIELIVMYRDPLTRRWGDRLAKTRTVDRPRKLAQAREKVQRRLAEKGIEPLFEGDLTDDPFARFVE